MKVKHMKSKDVVSYTISSDRNMLILLMKCVLIGTALVIAFRAPLWSTTALVVMSLLLRYEVSESVLAIDGLGLQLEKRGPVMFWSDDSRFYPKHSIMAVLINEVFEGFKVSYVLQIVVRDANEMSLIFPHLRPRLHVIEEIWQNIRVK